MTLSESRRPPYSDPIFLLLTAGVAAAVIASLSGTIGPYMARVALLPIAAWLILRHTGQLVDRRRRRFWRLWGLALLSWWATALLAVFAGLESPSTHALDLVGYLVVFLSVSVRPRSQVAENVQATVHRLRLTAALVTLFAVLAYLFLLPETSTAIVATSRVMPIVDLAAAFLLFQTARLLPSGLSGSCRTFALALLVGALLRLLYLVEVLPQLRLALETLPIWLFGLAGAWRRPRDVTLGPANPVGQRPFPIPSALWIAVPPLLHLSVGMPSDDRTLVWVTLGGTLSLALLSMVEHAAISRRNVLLEIEHRRAERGEESVYFKSLIEHSPLAIVVLDAQHNVKLCNPAFTKIFGYEQEEVQGTSLDRIIVTDEAHQEALSYTDRVMRGQAVHGTARRIRRDGEPIDVELHGIPLMEGDELFGIFALYQDITDRVTAERQLRESEERFRRLSDASFEGIVVSERGRIVDCNEQLARIMGTTQEELVGRHVLDFVVEEDRDRVHRLLQEGHEKPYQHRVQRHDGKEILLEAHVRELASDEGHRRITAIRDITDQKRLEEEMRQAQKMEAVGRLAGGIAHDFNNVLTVIKGYSQLIALKLADHPVRPQIDEIHEAAERASLMTQRLLAFGRKQPLQAQSLDLNAVLAGMEKMLRRLIRADIDLRLELAPELGLVEVDPGQFEQVVLNLVINAGDAMPGGGELVLSTANESIDEIRAATPPIEPGSYVSFRVFDTGKGMDEETAARAFEPFFTTKEKGKGTGLGLATVYAIVQQASGAIDLESEVDVGSTFTLFLPRLEGHDEAQPEEPEVVAAPQGRETVLVVEDEPGVRALAREFLASHGYRVLEAKDGKQGLEVFREAEEAARQGVGEAVRLVLTDVVMPEMNGPEMARRLVEEKPGLEVLFMSGYTDEILAPQDLADSWRLVQKPFSVEELLNKVRTVLDDAAPEDG